MNHFWCFFIPACFARDCIKG